jgi:hypothetical protein
LSVVFVVGDKIVPEVYAYGIYYWIPILTLIFIFATFNNSKKGVKSNIQIRLHPFNLQETKKEAA